MISFFIESIYNCCFGIKKRYKFNDVVHILEGLTDEEIRKMNNYYNRNKCC